MARKGVQHRCTVPSVKHGSRGWCTGSCATWTGTNWGKGGGRENEEGEEKGTWPARGTRRRNTPLVSRFHLDENGRSVERSTYVQQPFQASLSRYGYNAASDQPRKNVATRNHRRTGQKDIRETSIPLLEFPFVCILPRQPIFPRVRRENWNARCLRCLKYFFFIHTLERSQREATAREEWISRFNFYILEMYLKFFERMYF